MKDDFEPNDVSTRPWRVGYTRGGGLGIWSHGCKTDAPNVCLISTVPDARDKANAALIVAAVNAWAGRDAIPGEER